MFTDESILWIGWIEWGLKTITGFSDREVTVDFKDSCLCGLMGGSQNEWKVRKWGQLYINNFEKLGPINRGMDKKDVVHTYMECYSAIKREQNCAICRDVNGPRDCPTEWNKSKREKQIQYNITYMWNLEKRYKWTYLQSRNRGTDHRK